jgi:transposase, IS30 family
MPKRQKTPYIHLTPDERCQIETLLKRGDSKLSIAYSLNRSISTIRREITRNSGQRGYRKKQAQELSITRRKIASRAPIKMTPNMVQIIEDHLRTQQWSPVQISGWLLKNAVTTISHERIYQHIWLDKDNKGVLWKNLRHNGKKYNKRKGLNKRRGLIPNRVGIENRPKIVDEKTRIGDWEVDLIIGAGHKGALVTMVDRASKYTMIEWVARKSEALVSEALIRRLGAFKGKVLTITSDNGREFAGHEKIARDLKAAFYFAQPYHSWERGLNEHTNGLIRQYVPKNMPLNAIENEDVDRIENLLNNRPRKILQFSTPQEVFNKLPPCSALHC